MPKPHARHGSNPMLVNDNRAVRIALAYALGRTKCCTPLRPFSNGKVPK